MIVLADHCVPTSVLKALRLEGIRVLRVVDLVDPAVPDRGVADLALRLGAVLLTADADFQRRRNFPPRRSAGIVLLKDLQVAQDRVLRRLIRLLAAGPEGIDGCLAILDRRSARIKR